MASPFCWRAANWIWTRISVRIRAPCSRWWRFWRTQWARRYTGCELAHDCGLGVTLLEEQIPIRDDVRGACELLGLDPLHIANEGQFLAVVAAEQAKTALDVL